MNEAVTMGRASRQVFRHERDQSLAIIASFAVLARIALYTIPSRVDGGSALDWAAAADGQHYLRVASDWIQGPCYTAQNPAIARFSPGTPAVVALLAAVRQDEIFTLPFASLFRVSFEPELPRWKLYFIWAHVAIGLAGVCIGVLRSKRSSSENEGRLAIALIWWTGVFLFSVSTGTDWGFHDFPRYLSVGLPTLYCLLAPLLPRCVSIWLAGGLVAC